MGKSLDPMTQAAVMWTAAASALATVRADGRDPEHLEWTIDSNGYPDVYYRRFGLAVRAVDIEQHRWLAKAQSSGVRPIMVDALSESVLNDYWDLVAKIPGYKDELAKKEYKQLAWM